MKKVTIICCAYNRPVQAALIAYCFLAQTYPNWELHIIHDGKNDEVMDALAHIDSTKIFYHETKERYNDFGHSIRDIGLQYAHGDYILWTNEDNYYAPVFLEKMIAAITKDDFDFAYCDMVHSHQDYRFFPTTPKLGLIDMGAFIVKESIAKEIGFPDRDYCADGRFVDRVMARQGIRAIKVESVLFVHN